MDPSSLISSLKRAPLQMGIRPSSAGLEQIHMDSPVRLMPGRSLSDLLTEPAYQASEDSPARLAYNKSAGNTNQVLEGLPIRLMERRYRAGKVIGYEGLPAGNVDWLWVAGNKKT